MQRTRRRVLIQQPQGYQKHRKSMKLLKSMPKDTAFFERYADLTHTLTKVSVITQVFTGVCEIGILYALIYPSLNDLSLGYATTLSTLAAVFLAAILQMGLKKVFPYSVRAVLYKRFKGLDLAFSIGVFLLTIALLTVSVFLSYKGSKDIATFATPKPIERTTTAQDSAKNAATVAANSRFTTDSATIEAKFKGKTEALTAELQSRITTIERNAQGKQATTLRAELKMKLAVMQADKATEIQAKSDLRAATIDHETSRANSQTDEILSENKTAKQNAKAKTDSYSGYIGYFTLFCYVFFLFTYILNEIYHKGAKIDLTPMPSQRHFTPSVLTEFVEAAKERIDVFFRTKVYNFANNTAAQPMPDGVRVLYDFKAKTFDEVLTVEPHFEQTRVIKLPVKRHKLAATIQDDTPQKSRQIGFKKTDDTKNDTTEKQDDTGVHNDFRRNPILQDNTKTIFVNSGDYGKCENCGKDFFRNHKKQRFCCEDCRKEAWKNKTGKDFDLEVKNKERRKK